MLDNVFVCFIKCHPYCVDDTDTLSDSNKYLQEQPTVSIWTLKSQFIFKQ